MYIAQKDGGQELTSRQARQMLRGGTALTTLTAVGLLFTPLSIQSALASNECGAPVSGVVTCVADVYPGSPGTANPNGGIEYAPPLRSR